MNVDSLKIDDHDAHRTHKTVHCVSLIADSIPVCIPVLHQQDSFVATYSSSNHSSPWCFGPCSNSFEVHCVLNRAAHLENIPNYRITL